MVFLRIVDEGFRSCKNRSRQTVTAGICLCGPPSLFRRRESGIMNTEVRVEPSFPLTYGFWVISTARTLRSNLRAIRVMASSPFIRVQSCRYAWYKAGSRRMACLPRGYRPAFVHRCGPFCFCDPYRFPGCLRIDYLALIAILLQLPTEEYPKGPLSLAKLKSMPGYRLCWWCMRCSNPAAILALLRRNPSSTTATC